jgi:hypothetical protein
MIGAPAPRTAADPQASTINVMSTVREISDAMPTVSAPAIVAEAPVTAPAVKAVTPKRSARARRSGNLLAGQLEDLLRESGDGLSLVALAERAGVSDAKVRDRLRELERASGSRAGTAA